MAQLLYRIRIKKGDTIVVRTGKYKGKSGKVLSVHPQTNMVTVEGINIVKKHVKPNRQHPQGAIVELTKPIGVSKVGLMEPTSKKPTKVGYSINKSGEKIRIYKSTGKEIK